MTAPVIPDESLIVSNQPPPMCSLHIVSFSGLSVCLHVKPLKKSYTNCHVILSPLQNFVRRNEAERCEIG